MGSKFTTWLSRSFRWTISQYTVWYDAVQRPTWHTVRHFGDDFTGHVTQPTLS